MRAAVVYQHGGPDALRVVDNYADPVPQSGEVILRVGATSLNYHDVFTRQGMPGIKIPLPIIMGIDFAGEIAGVGPDVSGWSVGQRVLVDPLDRVHWTGLIGEMRPGGLAEYCAVPAAQLVPLPAGVSDEAAACLPVAYGTAHRMMTAIGRIQPGEKVLVLGASGGVGTGCVQLAKLAGAEVIACASTPAKLERLRQLGADHLFDYSSGALHTWVHQRFGKPHRRDGSGGVDVVVNFTGGDTWVPSLRCLRRGGRLLTCGATAGFAPTEDLRYIWTFELQIMGSNGWAREDVTRLLSLVEQKKFVPIVDKVFPLSDAGAAMQHLESRQAFGKVVVRP
jgi:NADPH:quinone reductase-like Zn-dependent oxidoreductase